MLSSLTIRDVVLIDRLEVGFESGLGVLTGETGAGKSILLDALGLALGVRAESRLVRHGADQAAVTALFDVGDGHPARAQLAEHGVETAGEALILRRALSADGRSRAFINDQAVSVGLLRDIGGQLVEVHGQFESQKLLRSESHRWLLDAFGGHKDALTSTAQTFTAWRDARAATETARADAEAAKQDEDFLRHAVAEMQELNPESGEEAALAATRSMMMHGEKLAEALSAAYEKLAGNNGGENRLQSAAHTLEAVAETAQGRLDQVIATLERAIDEAADASTQLERLSADLTVNPAELEQAEERLFALRALARKHGAQVDDLAALQKSFSDQLANVEYGDARIAELEKAESAAHEAYVQAASELRKLRRDAAGLIDQRVTSELGDLKLEKARFHTDLAELVEGEWAEHGMDRVAFLVTTNPNTPPGPINKIASGGEMARFMLALKVALADADPVPTLVFDEVDAGIGGAVASAVGDRLAKLGESCQVLVVTHSPQVAARGGHHWRVSKSETANDAADGRVWTTVEVLDQPARKEEVARMLAGAEVTDEARAAADRLLAGGGM